MMYRLLGNARKKNENESAVNWAWSCRRVTDDDDDDAKSMESSFLDDAASFKAVADRVRGGTLVLTLCFGPPRGGTTATERWLFEEFDFDGNVNQPGLLARDDSMGGLRDRVEATWAAVLAKVENCESLARRCGRNVSESPITIVVKETSNVVLPESEMKLWRRVCHSILLVYRNPVLQLESRICCILNRISAGATSDLGVGADIDPRTFSIAGERLVRADTDFGHIDDEADTTEQSLWEQHYGWMKRNRDYSSLDAGFVRYAALHPLFEEPQVQRECLHLATKEDAAVSDDDISACVGSRLEDFDSLPEFFHRAFFEWRFGWIEFMEQLDRCSGFQNLSLIDMSDLQASPQFFRNELDRRLVHSSAEDVARAAALEESSRGFDVSSRGGEWDTWFLTSCNWDSMAKTTADIRPPSKRCLPLSALPQCVLEIVPGALRDFISVRSDPRTLRCPNDLLKAYEGVDHVQDYVNRLISCGGLDRRSSEAAANMRPYFDIIDKIVDEAVLLPPPSSPAASPAAASPAPSADSSSVDHLMHIDIRKGLLVGFEWIDVERLNPHEQYIEQRHTKLLEYVRDLGPAATLPAVVVSSKTLAIVDGHHRYSVIKAMGVATVPCMLVDYHSDDIVLVASPTGEGDRTTTTSKQDVLSAASSGRLLTPKSSKHMVRDTSGALHPIEMLSPTVNVLSPPPPPPLPETLLPGALPPVAASSRLETRPVRANSKMHSEVVQALYRVEKLPSYLTYPRAAPQAACSHPSVAEVYLRACQQVSLVTHARAPTTQHPSLQAVFGGMFGDASGTTAVSCC